MSFPGLNVRTPGLGPRWPELDRYQPARLQDGVGLTREQEHPRSPVGMSPDGDQARAREEDDLHLTVRVLRTRRSDLRQNPVQGTAADLAVSSPLTEANSRPTPQDDLNWTESH